VRIALGQLESGADIRANLAAIDRFGAEAARDGAALVAFPECATYEKKRVDATFPEVAEPLDGPICRELGEITRRHRIVLVAGVVETSDEPGRAYNTLVAFGPDGGRLAFYRKIHLFDAQGFGESEFIKPGLSTTPVVFGSGGVRFDDLQRPAVPGIGKVSGRRRRAGPAGLLVLGAGRAQAGAVAGVERGPRH
jgi:deaminated glutathione amidase